MTKKGKILTAVVILILLSSFASAQNIADAFEPLLDFFAGFYQLFNSGQYSHYFMRFIIWLVGFTLFLTAVRRTPFWSDDASQQKYAKIISLLLSLSGAMLIPTPALENMFFTIGILFIVAFVAAIINIIRGIAETSGGGSAALVALIIALSLYALNTLFFSFSPYDTNPVLFGFTLYELVNTIATIVILYAIYLFASSRGSGGSGGGKGSGRGWNPFKGGKRALNPGNAAPPGPRTGTVPSTHPAHALEALIDEIRANVAKIHDTFHMKLVPNADADAQNNHDAFEDPSIPRNTAFQSQYLADLNDINHTIDDIIKTAKDIRGHSAITSWTPQQKADFENAIISLKKIIKDISDFHKRYSFLLSGYHEPRK